MNQILFLRAQTESEPGEAPTPDEYETAASDAGYSSTCIPILSSNLVESKLAELDRILLEQPECRGIIATSKRGVEALQTCIGRIASRRVEWTCESSWKQIPVYTVGPSTARIITQCGFTPLGSDTGRAAKLAKLIISDTEKESSTTSPYIMLCGDKRRDELPSQLTNAKIPFMELIVYETGPNPVFEQELVKTYEGTDVSQPAWIVFFSPSGVDFALEPLKRQVWWQDVRIGAIGPTTSARLKQLDLKVDVESPKPTAIDLIQAIRDAVTTHTL
ncbi:uroporphyrinogen-III synthase [Synchytrium microbalum]|uniref:Uroporphyrinogen-III synthase n=1 Tax=Synchytrium microbalum TaxID=1806994 RepID=A0A507CE26_9FUNG|nr:uroporphyrinogen-III synthase [Synchytrium microbalum]TPX36296.1 uroporphyrinogen-III synthase [Synchytrium microbalum]